MIDKVVSVLKQNKKFLVCSHFNPEGDAIGSMLAMMLGLRQLGKEAQSYNQDPIPFNLLFLPGSKEVKRKLGDESYDVAITVDSGDKSRVGEKFLKFKNYKTLINIDHHQGNTNFGDVNFVLPEAASTGEVVHKILTAAGCSITPEIATNIYCTLVVDTGSFRYSNTTAATLKLASELVTQGAIPHVVALELFDRQPKARLDLLMRVLSRLEITCGGKCGSITLLRKDLQELSATKDLTEDFVNYPRSIDGVEVALFFKEQPDGNFRISCRSKGLINVAAICEKYSGGGHKQASACLIKGSLDEAKKILYKEVQHALSC